MSLLVLVSIGMSLLVMGSPSAASAAYHDVVVYGGSSAAVTAAIAASQNGTRPVALVEPHPAAGGMVSVGGLGLNDALDYSYASFLFSGLTDEWLARVSASYNTTERVWLPDMYVAQQAIDAMLADRPSISVYTGCTLTAAAAPSGTIVSLTAACADNASQVFAGRVFVDASVTGDLVVAAGVSYAWGREGRGAYNESLAGVMHYGDGEDGSVFPPNVSAVYANGTALPWVMPGAVPPAGAADDGVMAFQHRACVTTDADRTAFPAPPGYTRDDFALLLRLLATGSLGPSPPLSRFMSLIPYSSAVAAHGRHKYMICCGGTPFDSDAVTANLGYLGPGALTPGRRAELDALHTRYLLGMLFFLGTDAAVPAATRADVGRYGLCSDEWQDAAPVAHWPPALYVREGVRLVNDAVLTQSSLVNPRLKPDGVAVGAWYFDKHIVGRYASPATGNALNEGHFRASTSSPNAWCASAPPPDAGCTNITSEWYDIPLSAMLPRRSEASNLVVAAALAASSVAASSIRIESMLLSTGAAAGIAASAAVERGCDVQDVPVSAVQAALLEEYGQVIHGPPSKAPKRDAERASKV